jgi:hypothetical protein
MFLFDVETLSKSSEAVILSMACTHFIPEEKPTPDQLRANTFFAKFNVEDQIRRLHRKTGKSTMEWWAKQCDNVKIRSFKPNPDIDEIFEDGYERMRTWVHTKNDKDYVWARGGLDQLVMDSIEEQLEITPIFPYARWRDVRTGVDFLHNRSNGYCEVNYEGFNPDHHITKHDPIDDCILDAMMLMYGKKKDFIETMNQVMEEHGEFLKTIKD